MRDPYDILGVPRKASDAEIKKAYRKLAKELHPDVNPDDSAVAERFKEVSVAYKILGDEQLRRRYDAGEIGPDGQEKSQFRYEYAGGRPGGGAEGFDFGGFNAEDIFGEFFSNMRGDRRGRRGGGPRKGTDRAYKITVDFLDAAKGATRRVTLPDGKMLDIKIPAGITDGKQIRLRGQGDADPGGGHKGDALVEVSVRDHPLFRRDGDDIHLDLPITLAEAVLGARVEVPTIGGNVKLNIPKGADSGQVLRLKGKGIHRARAKTTGNQFVRLQIKLPEQPDPELEKLIKKWAEKHPDTPFDRFAGS
ncbi:MAG: J domain-containing protein [Alphaproteobacteria bacterium]|nr:J domain-containing protein [Alphaproteobacteria bacterium]MDP6814737.1 J domain-containing protein [Alphaproteobacteria bacterium]